ncbi:MAG: cytochrome P450 [Sandaracinaceae bacterium]
MSLAPPLSRLVDKTKARFEPPSPPPGLRPPPRLEGGLPLVGHTVDFVRSTLGLLDRARKEHGEVAAFDVAGKSMIAFFGPDAHEALFRAPDTTMNPSEAYKIMTPVFGEGMVYDAPPDKMAEQMKMLLPALKDRRMRTYGETILAEVEDAIADWGDSGTIDIVDFCRVLTNFTSSHCLIGSEFRNGMTDEFARIYHDLERGVTPLAYINANLPIPSFRRRDKARVRLVELISDIVDARMESGRTGEDFLQTLMEARYKDGRGLTHDEITGMLLAAMFAGHHTSSVTTAWTLIELCRNADYQSRLVNELDDVYGDEGPTDYGSLRRILHTEHAVKEVLRLHPPLFMLVRVAMKDFAFKGFHIPKGSWCLISPTVSHRIPEVFAQPDRFDPDRYGPDRREDKKDWAYIPFGGGRHKCLGNAFAILQVKAILATLLRRYEFELLDHVEPDFHGLVIGPSEPCRLRYRRRTNVGKKKAVTEAEAAAPAPKVHLTVSVDKDLCQGHAVCVEEAPEVFGIGDDGKVDVKQAQPDPSLHAKVRSAASYCPNNTIRLTVEPAAACPFH